MNKLLAFGWGITLLAAPLASAHAQQTTPPSVSLEVRDAPIRSALLQLFDAAKVQYSIDPAVMGFVNLRITDQPFESALKLVLRSSSVPLTYTVENGVYFVKVRVIANPPMSVAPPPPSVSENTGDRLSHFEVIQLTYADPYDLAQLLNILLVPVGTRGSGNASGGAGGAPTRGTGGIPGGGTGILGGGGSYLGGTNPNGGSFIAGPFAGGGSGTVAPPAGGSGGPGPRG